MIQDLENPNVKSTDEDKFNRVAGNLERGGYKVIKMHWSIKENAKK